MKKWLKGGDGDAIFAVELVHLGSLYHDDVIDEAVTRRTVESVNARWGNLTAILVAMTNWLLVKARIQDLKSEGVQLLELDDAGAITAVRVLLRPIRAAMALSALMESKIERLPNRTYGLRAEYRTTAA